MEGQEWPRSELREHFYESVAETLTLLHAAPGYDRRLALVEVARILAITMDLPLVWIGRREPGRSRLELTAAGPAADYASSLRVSDDAREPGGRGPVGIVLREGRARVATLDSPEFAPWREAALRHGLGSCIAAASGTSDGGQLVLVAYSHMDGPALTDELLDWAQRLVDELARFWDDQALVERNLRLSRYRDAQRTIQRAMLDQPDPDAVFFTLAHALVDVAGAVAVDVYVAEGTVLRRVALAGPMAEAMRALPEPPIQPDAHSLSAPTLTFTQALPVVRVQPSGHPDEPEVWRTEPLTRVGAIGCWPVFSEPAEETTAIRTPAAVFLVATTEPDAFDADMHQLLEEIAEAAGLALRQHQQRHALYQEQERQTYLALHDALTDLPNRRALDYHLEHALARAQRHRSLVAVGLLDMDDFKPINDRYGHAAGDRVLVELATRLREALRSEDYVARLGGDEFVLVFEDLEHENDLEPLLDRVEQSLRRPMTMEGASFPLAASLGIALYSIHAHASGEQLLRRADQAMYQIKADKRQRSRWWAVALPSDAAEPAVEHAGASAMPPYGERAAARLAICLKAWQAEMPGVADSFYEGLLLKEGIARLLGAIPAADVDAFKHRLSQHLLILLDPHLEVAAHRSKAKRSGLFHAACGLEEVWLLEAIELLRDILATALGALAHGDRKALSIVLQRLGMERQWQLESMRELQRRRVALLARLNAIAWSAEGYLELIQGAVDILASHEEIMACAAGRPDESGYLTYEAVAGAAFAEYLRALVAGHARPIRVSQSGMEGDGPSGRAWRTARIHRCAHYGSDPAMLAWRDMAASLGVVSSVAIPLCPLPLQPAVVLTLYSPYAGGFHSEDQQAFVEQIKTVLDLALARLAPPRQGTELLPFFMRERWRALVATEAIEMHYQPVVRLTDGRVGELEALARLRDEDGVLLAPARFLPALGADDLIALFRQGLTQAMACRESLRQAGHTLDMSVNAPAAALEDSRYAETAATAIAASTCPAAALLFEILESPIGTEHSVLLAESGMQSLKALGVRLVEDDLGAGYSSLIRLRQWPFDRVKIDQAIVTQVRREPLSTLRFIRQLIRIGHDLGLEVVVEGLESPGLIEAASILAADFGQGYALARPMPPQAVPAWLIGFRPGWDKAHPRTCLGALAGELRWEEEFMTLPAEPAFWARHAQVDCVPGEYLRGDAGTFAALSASHHVMHKAAIGGPFDPDYRRERSTFLSLLTEQALVEENGDEGKSALRG
ncbi:diguanylate cyclase domain-containing protein [Rhodanobacter ginsengisoli]|uniref:Diguanylate cyclase domain-containing protein n=1 Tax=Rhodanobacter ginsengisoli TaxID=418646 RepID=A0ABW0QNP0_9GAMM